MTTWIALLRGINVGGHHRLPMAEFRQDLEGLGLEQVRTYIQSGNVVFRSDPVDAGDAVGAGGDTLGEAIAAAIEERHGFRPDVLVLSAGELRQAMEANPFPDAGAEPRTLHLFFLARQPTEDVARLAEAASATERFHVGDRVFYLHAPDGFGRSRLASKVESILRVPATARNWRTVSRLREMVKEASDGDA